MRSYENAALVDRDVASVLGADTLVAGGNGLRTPGRTVVGEDRHVAHVRGDPHRRVGRAADDDIPFYGDRSPTRARSDERSLLRPLTCDLVEHVDLAGSRQGRRTDGSPVPVHVDGRAEQAIDEGPEGQQLLDLRPGRPRALEDIDRTGVAGHLVVLTGADEDRVSVDRHGEAELGVDRAVRRHELGLFGPAAADSYEHVSRTGAGPGRRLVVRNADHDRVAGDIGGEAELVPLTRIRCLDPGHFVPRVAAALEDVGRPGVFQAGRVRTAGPSDGPVAVCGQGIGELISDLSVAGEQLVSLDGDDLRVRERCERKERQRDETDASHTGLLL